MSLRTLAMALALTCLGVLLLDMHGCKESCTDPTTQFCGERLR